MKLLLTSAGLRNRTIIRTFLELAGKPADKLKVAFITTAMNVEPGDKGWAIDQMLRLRDLGIDLLDLVDPSAVSKDIWLPRLEVSDVIFVNGGNTTHLMDSFNKSGLTAELPALLKSRLYVGSSAGSYVVTPDTRFNSDHTDKVFPGLGLVDFGLQVHLNSPKFPQAKNISMIKQKVKDCPYIVYALDDEMAIAIDGQNMEIVGEGKYHKLLPWDNG